MSHFLVIALVRPNTPNIHDEVERLLAPFHEFECTGLDDQYVQTLDVTDERRSEWENSTTRKLRSPEGSLFDPWEEQFYREPTDEEKEKIGPFAGTGFGGGISYDSRDWGDGRGYRAKIRFIPEGWVEAKIPTREIETFREFIERYHEDKVVAFGEEPQISGDEQPKHKYGYATLTKTGEIDRVYRRTNPNNKWDWWVIGGRWNGTLSNTSPEKNPNNYEICYICNGTGTRSDTTYGSEAAWARKGNELFPCIGNGCNACYGAGKKLKWPTEQHDAGNIVPVAEMTKPRGFAFVTPEGEWIEKGQMGWWACVKDEKEDDAWEQQSQAILDKYKDCLAVAVDCHI